MRVGLAIVLGTLLPAVSPVNATTFYVRSAGSDANDGLTPATAWRSIRSAARRLLNAGDVLIVGPGDYSEGNIEPRRGGAPGEPIELLADASGANTGDAPGPVRVLPHGDQADETTGFIVFGESHLRIEGFQIEGASDAGIQVRPAARTGALSRDIQLRGITVLNSRNGIDIDTAGSSAVLVENNIISHCTSVGVLATATSSDNYGLQVRGNRISNCGRAINATRQQQASITENLLETNNIGVGLNGGRDISIGGNTMQLSHNHIQLVSEPAAVVIADNQFDGGARGVAGGSTESVTISGNRFTAVNGAILLSTGATATINDNRFDHIGYAIQINSRGDVALHNNRMSNATNGVTVSARGSLSMVENVVDASYRGVIATASTLEMTDNLIEGSGLVGSLRAASMSILSNSIVQGRSPLFIEGASRAEIRGNSVSEGNSGLWYRALSEAPGVVVFDRNTLSGGLGIRVGRRTAAPAVDVIATRNQVLNAESGIRLATNGSVEISDNDIAGIQGMAISASLNASSSRAAVNSNRIAESRAGIDIEHAQSTIVYANRISDILTSGCVVRDTARVEVSANHLTDVGHNGIVIAPDALLEGDCNRDGRVEASEIKRSLQRLFSDDPAADCSALNPQQDGHVTVASILAAISHSADGIHTRAAAQVQITDNEVQRTGSVGVVAYASEAGTVRNNTVERSGATGMSLTGAPDAAISVSDTRLAESGADGMLISGGAVATVSNSTIDSSTGSALRIRDTTAVQVRDAVIRDAAGPGILATLIGTWSSSRNYVANSGGGVAVIGAASAGVFATLDHETVEMSGGAGLLIDRALLIALSDSEITGSARDSVNVQRSQVVRLLANRLLGSGGSAIVVGPITPAAVDVLIADNVLGNFQNSGVEAHVQGRTLVLHNDIEGATGNTGAGVALSYPTLSVAGLDATAGIDANEIHQGGGDGVLIEHAEQAFVWNNRVDSRRQTGIRTFDTGRTEVVNSLSYANGEDGVRLDKAEHARVFNNTSYRNGRWGVVSQDVAALLLFNNIFDANHEGSVVVGIGEAPNVSESHNLSTGVYVGLTPDISDIDAPPLFVDPDGADDELGGAHARDDDFHLLQGEDDDPLSPAIDAGSATAEVLGISGSTASDGRGDTGLVDLGYHYDASPRIP